MSKHQRKIISLKKEKQMRIVDNFDQCGRDSFTKLALLALDVLGSNTQAKPSIDK